MLRPRDRTAGFAYEQLAGRGVPRRARDLEVRIEAPSRDPGEVERRGSCTAEVAHRAGEPGRDGGLRGTLGRVVAESGGDEREPWVLHGGRRQAQRAKCRTGSASGGKDLVPDRVE